MKKRILIIFGALVALILILFGSIVLIERLLTGSADKTPKTDYEFYPEYGVTKWTNYWHNPTDHDSGLITELCDSLAKDISEILKASV